jgi:hypothetical protein
MTLLTESEFDALYKPRVKRSGDLFDFEDVVNKSMNTVWTVVEAEDDDGREHWIACPGFHVVNKMGYILTKKPWVTGDEGAYWFYDDRDPAERSIHDDEKNEGVDE